jgi:hypothetical protein
MHNTTYYYEVCFILCTHKCRFCRFPDSNPAEVRPGSQISGPEAVLRNIPVDGKCCHKPNSKRSVVKEIPKCFCLPSGFLEAWGTKVEKPHNFKEIIVCCPCRLRRQGRTTTLFLKMCGFLPWYPRPPKKHLAPKTLRDPFDVKLDEKTG